QFGPFWGTLAIEVTFAVADEPVIVAPGELKPTSPPRPTLTIVPPLTWPLAETFSILPALIPASVPTRCEVTPGFAFTVALVRLRPRISPALPMAANSPMFWVVESDGWMVRLLIVWPWPSKIVFSADVAVPRGAKFAMEPALMSVPRA